MIRPSDAGATLDAGRGAKGEPILIRWLVRRRFECQGGLTPGGCIGRRLPLLRDRRAGDQQPIVPAKALGI